MSLALYKDAAHPKDIKAGEHGGNAGLFWGKFFDGFNATFTDFADKESSKRDFMRKFTGNRGNATAINAAALRQIALTKALGGVWFIASNTDASPFVTGTGNSHPVENGFLWHHTLSTPYMQGSAVKGIMRSWLENQLGYGVDEDDNHSELKRYFGSETKASADNQAGDLIFFDAIPIVQPRLKVEIMTPHMGDYYADKGKTAPADWHSPTPIPLLAVESISLLFCIAPRLGKIDASELEKLSTALQNALANMGAGAKTQTGFGRLVVNEKETIHLANSINESNQSELSKRAQNLKEKFIAEGGQPNAASGNDIFKFLSELSLENISKDEIADIRILMKTYKPSSKKDKEFKAIRNQFNAKFPE
jgi:CRISPR-associated protein Cmr6